MGKIGPASIGASRLGEIRGVGPAPDGEQDFQLPVLLLEQEELLDTAVHIGANVVPRIGGVMLLDVGPGVGQVTASIRFDITEMGWEVALTLHQILVGHWQTHKEHG